ncbi:MAG: acyl-CoA dehydrogenase, partial [Planctomycetota bacterium]
MKHDLETSDLGGPASEVPAAPPSPSADNSAEEASFAETALKLGGKSDDEARRTGAIDKADDQVEALFAPKYQTVHSPAHRAVWDRRVPADEFVSDTPAPSDAMRRVMAASLEVVRRHKSAGTLHNDDGRIREEVLAELGEAGY